MSPTALRTVSITQPSEVINSDGFTLEYFPPRDQKDFQHFYQRKYFSTVAVEGSKNFVGKTGF